MRRASVEEILGNIQLPKDMTYHYDPETKLVKVGMHRPDTYTGEMGIGWGGKAYISSHATDDEVVKKVFGLCMNYVEHELREAFQYVGQRVFGPHISLAALVEAAPKTTYRTGN